MVGVGLRLAQEAGAHRLDKHALKPTAENELRKRVFWYAPAPVSYA